MHWWKFIILKRENKMPPYGRLGKLGCCLFLGFLEFVKGFDLFLGKSAVVDPDVVYGA